MVLVQNNDMFVARLVTLIAEYDRETLTNLYQPLVGHTAISLYFTLWSEANVQKVSGMNKHDNLLARMQLATGDFIKARKALEAVGLIKTSVETIEGGQIFYYDLFAPKTPNDFLNDTLLFGLLIKYIGENDANKLKQYYLVKDKKNPGEDISASFSEVFHPNFEDPAFIKAISSDMAQGRNRAKIKTEFSYETFINELKQISQINEKAFTKSDLAEISRLSDLYGVKEAAAANIVANFYNPSLEKGKRLDFVNITKAFQEETNYAYLSSSKFTSTRPNLVSSSGALASKINMMETISPKDFLAVLQNGSQPALPDLKLVDGISRKFKLPNPVINAIIDFVLTTNNNVLSRPYCEKIAASLAREGVTTTVDAMNYLKKISHKGKSVSQIDKSEIKVTNKTKKKETECDWNTLVDEIAIEGDDEDGKA